MRVKPADHPKKDKGPWQLAEIAQVVVLKAARYFLRLHSKGRAVYRRTGRQMARAKVHDETLQICPSWGLRGPSDSRFFIGGSTFYIFLFYPLSHSMTFG